MRDIDSAIVTALAAKSFKRRTFFSITARNFSTGDPVAAYFWNDLGPITCNCIDGVDGSTVSRTFTGSGTLIQCGSIPLSSDMNVRTVTVTLNQVDSRIDDYVRGYDLKNAYCEIHRGMYNPLTHALLAAIVPIFVGFDDSLAIESPAAGNPGKITLNLVSHTRELTRAGYSVRSHADQIARVPGDDIMKYSGVMASAQFFWGVSKVGGTNIPASGLGVAGAGNARTSKISALIG